MAAKIAFVFTTDELTEAEVYAHIAAQHGYTAEVEDRPGRAFKPNPESVEEFARRKVREYIEEMIHADRVKIAKRTAEEAVRKVILEPAAVEVVK